MTHEQKNVQVREVLKRYQQVTVVGAGVIGLSWTALFLAHGLKVVVNDPRTDLEQAVMDGLKQASPAQSLEVPQGTPVTTCADPVHKQFWCHTKAACWLSHLFYQEKKAEFHPKTRVQIERRLAEFFASLKGCAVATSNPENGRVRRPWEEMMMVDDATPEEFVAAPRGRKPSHI